MRTGIKFYKLISLTFFISVLCSCAYATEENEESIEGLAFDGTKVVEDSCQVLSSNGNEKPTLHDVPGMHVLNRTKSDSLVMYAVDNVVIKGIVCWRSPAKFSANDYLIPEKLGYPFYIKSDSEDEKNNRTFTLEKIGGNFRIRLLSGPDIKPQEKTEIIKILSHYEQAIKKGTGT